MSNLVQKVKDVLKGDKDTTTTTGHGVNESDNAGSITSGSTNAGPHSSNTANKADPRVDSDMDGSATLTGGNTSGGSMGHTLGSTTGSTNAGLHTSNAGNKFDPRVDSDMDGSTTLTGGSTGTGTGHTLGTTPGHTAHHGHHKTATSNALDPNVSSTGSAGMGVGSTHTGVSSATSTTAGPHKSGTLNKLDPRQVSPELGNVVDSDLDGSKTLGRDKTFSGTNTLEGATTISAGGNLGRENALTDASGIPLDAATHKPSEFAAIHGNPSHGRNGSKVADDLQKYGGGHE
ncbi:MAG: hypothetical protein MMC33_001883 [Icmadophila ericetorum]|nr:hypothetical protein [Icmadophila ericetorum]